MVPGDKHSAFESGKINQVDRTSTHTLENEPLFDTDTPLVSCIMPTRNRRNYIRQSILYFDRQDYPNRELIIVDDGDEPVADLLPHDDPRIRYFKLNEVTSIGTKRNLACKWAEGEIIAHWDDDDWYAPHRLSHQILPLLHATADITALETSCFFDLNLWKAWIVTPELHKRIFVSDVHGGTLVFWKWIWQQLAHYPDISIAEDAYFLVDACNKGRLLQKLPHAGTFVYLRHSQNAWRFQPGSYIDPNGWEEAEPETFIPSEDIPFYQKLTSKKFGGERLHFNTIIQEQNRPHAIIEALPSNISLPLVSCIMPTYNRRAFVGQAIYYFLQQDYANRELIIVDDGEESIMDLIPTDHRIRYARLNERVILGRKRNLACEMARGAYIAHWDDDDWSAPHRLRYQVELLERQKADLCGANRQLYFDPYRDQAWLYDYPATGRLWLAGNTLCFRKAFWVKHPFPEIAVGEDTQFIWSSPHSKAVVTPDHKFYIGLIHPANTSKKFTNSPYWFPQKVETIYNLLGKDLLFYSKMQKQLEVEEFAL